MILTLHEFGFPFLWGLLMLVSWIGWGELLRRAVGLDRARIDWGLLAGWGMSVTLAIAGFLQLARRADREWLLGLLFAGVALEGLAFWRRLRSTGAPRCIFAVLRPRRMLPLLPVLLLLALFYVASIQRYTVGWWDDQPAYFVMIRRLLQNGILLDPYSVRRLLTFGGQQVLDAQLLGAVSFFHIDILEQGLARIVFAGLLWGAAPAAGGRRRWPKGLILLLLLLIPIPHANSNSQLTGAVMFLTLLRTFEFRWSGARPLRRAIPVALVAAAFATMRMNFVATAGLAMALAYGARLLWPRMARRKVLIEAAAAFGLFVLLLLPWSMVLQESSHTLLYPLFRGTQRADYDYLNAHLTALQTFAWVWRFIGVPGIPPLAGAPAFIQEPFFAMPALLFPLLLVFHRRFGRDELPFYLAAVAAAFLTLFTYTLTEYSNLYRFIFPALFAVAAPVLLRALLEARQFRRVLLPAALFLFLILANLLRPLYDQARHRDSDSFAATYGDRWNVLTDAAGSPFLEAMGQRPVYQAAQESIPAGKAFFAAVSSPSLFDFARNPIFAIDMVGGASPDPGMPLLDGSQAVKGYLKRQGIDYLVFSNPERDLAHLSRAVWGIAGSGSEATPAFRRVAKFNLAAINDFEALAASEETLYRDDTLRVLRLK